MTVRSTDMLTSLYGRRIGLRPMSTGQTGAHIAQEFLVGPDDQQRAVVTETTATNCAPSGISILPGTSAASSAVYTIDPPIPGVKKTVIGGTGNGPVYLKTANLESILSTIGSTFTTVKISSIGGAFEMVGVTTAQWLAYITSGTSSQASGFGVTTST